MRFRDHPFNAASSAQDRCGGFPRRNDGARELIAVRWHVDADHTLRLAWPQPGDEAACVALGWVAADRPIGVITAPDTGLPDHLLDLLDHRFPGRRWFAGEWTAADTPPRLAA